MTGNEIIKVLTDEKKNILKKYENAVNELNRLREINKDLSNKYISLNNQLEDILSKISILDDDSAENNEINQYVDENNRLNEIISKLNEENDNINLELNEYKRENERLSNVIDELNEELNLLKQPKTKRRKNKNIE